jgi:argininosuccinate synthase
LELPIARPLIAKKQIEIAQQVNAEAVSHGATGKGNDQIRFELGYYYHQADIEIISPWRIWDMNSRLELVKYADQHNIEIAKDKRGEQPFSIDANVLHSSAEGKVLEDPFVEAPEYVYTRSVSPFEAPNELEEVTIEFKSGDACAVNGETLSPYQILEKLNTIGGKHGVGRIDLVENRFIGMKSRGIYETPWWNNSISCT